jgi:hypothetical protein
MRPVFLYCLVAILLLSCSKNKDEYKQGSKVDIYVLKSFSENVGMAGGMAVISISNAVLADAPLVSDQDIESYTRATTTFKIKKDIKSIIENYSKDKAFAVTVDNQPVYFGKFHPLYLSSMTLGVATLNPISYSLHTNNELQIDFITITGNSSLQHLDKRNDSRILDALRASGRLK